MKNFNIIYPMLLLLSVAGCSKSFLEEENRSNVNSGGFLYYCRWIRTTRYLCLCTASHHLCITIYVRARNRYVHGRTGRITAVCFSEYRTLNADDANVTVFYTALYKAVQTCNIGLYYNDKTAEASTLGIAPWRIKIPESILIIS